MEFVDKSCVFYVSGFSVFLVRRSWMGANYAVVAVEEERRGFMAGQ